MTMIMAIKLVRLYTPLNHATRTLSELGARFSRCPETPIPHIPTYNVDDVKIEWHPRVGREPEVMSWKDWGERSAPKVTRPSNSTPWKPFFKTREDFELADIFRKYGMKVDDQDKVIKLMKAGPDGKSKVTFEGAADVTNAWELAKLDLVNVR